MGCSWGGAALQAGGLAPCPTARLSQRPRAIVNPGLTCPYCSRPLREVDYHGTHIDACDCGGIWFDAEEIGAWARANGRNEAIPDGRNCAPFPSDPYRCPRCAVLSLESRVLDGIHFARCEKCAGVWLTPEGAACMNPAGAADRSMDRASVLEAIGAFLQMLGSAWRR
jgi:Zn-finger nucleic acid-binding protein